MSTKPSDTVRFGVDGSDVDTANLSAPSAGERDTGTATNEILTSGRLNYFFNRYYRWIQYLSDGALSGDHSVSGDLHVTEDLVADAGVFAGGDLGVGGNASITGTLGVGAALTTSGARFIKGAITPTTITDSSVHSNFAPTGFSTCGVIRQVVSGTNIPTYGGLAGGADGRFVYLICMGATVNDKLALSHEDAASTSSNRFSLPNATGITLPQFGAVTLRYDATTSRWHVFAKNF